MYANPIPGAVTLMDGSVIAFPDSTPATQEQCLPYQCGKDPSNEAARYWCAFWGRSGARAPQDPACGGPAPVFNPVTGNPAPMPKPTAAEMPSMTNTALITSLSPKPDLTPQDLLKPMPSIVNTTPAQLPSNGCGGFAQWVDENPLLAAGVLAGLAWMMFKK